MFFHFYVYDFQFGNLPYGFRANTWLVPPLAAASPAKFPPLPKEDESWGGSEGGLAGSGSNDRRPWATEFSILASLPSKTEEERQVRDRKAFLLHSLFVDISVCKAVSLIRRLVDGKLETECSSGLVVYEEQVGDLHTTIRKDRMDACSKLDDKIDSRLVNDIAPEDVSRKNLLKGITADESVTVHV